MFLFILKKFRERDSFHPVVSSPDGCSDQGWGGQAQARSQEHWVDVADTGSDSKAVSRCFPRQLPESWTRSRTAGMYTSIHIGCLYWKWQFSLKYYNASPRIFLLRLFIYVKGRVL